MKMNSLVKNITLIFVVLMGITLQAQAKNAMHIVINNHLGAPEMLIDENQQVVWQAEYDEFGKATILVEQVEFNHRFPGQYYDKETGLSYNYYRDYDPSLGRYVQSDPIGLAGGINTYGYVGGNPVSYIDPLGLAIIEFLPQGTSANSTYNQSVVVMSNSGELLGIFEGSSTPNPFNPSNPDIKGTDAYPQVAPGSYPAVNGPHKGEPAVVINNNQALPTTAPNPNFPSQGTTATFVHLHSGYNDKWKGSAACPTIAPSQWQDFIASLPNEKHTVIIP